MNLIPMFFTMILVIYLPCYYGNGITAKSSELSTDVYECEWLAMNRSFKKTMIIAMQRLNRLTVLTVGWIFPINLATFSLVKFDSTRRFRI